MINWIDAVIFGIDTGVLVLIWTVQLVIYPSLENYSIIDLKKWHPSYTRRITIIVMPLMILQLILSFFQLLSSQNVSHYLHLLMIISAWIWTFARAVPLHTRLDTSDHPIDIAERLTKINWWRTFFWTMTWIITLIGFFYQP